MSDMKCPVCKTGNVEQGKYDKEYFCDNEFCSSYDETDSSTYNILIRTRKALDVAVDALKDIRCVYTGDQTTKPSTMFGRAAGALNKIQKLEQITAILENKNGNC